MKKNTEKLTYDELYDLMTEELLGPEKPWSKAQLKKWSKEHKKMREEEEKLFKNSQSC